jgi:FAD/FMN-containing dehydrogenase
LVDKLAGALDGETFADPAICAIYGTDASIYQIPPVLVVCPKTGADVGRLVQFARDNSLSLSARGAATGLAGESLTPGICLDFSVHMRRLLSIDAHRGVAVVQPGCTLQEINDKAASFGKRFGPDPSSGNRATIGGMLANNATGSHWVKYGYTSDHVDWLEAVLSDGSRAKFYADGKVEGDSPLVHDITQLIPSLLAKWQQRIAFNWPHSPRNRAGYGVRDALVGKAPRKNNLISYALGRMM